MSATHSAAGSLEGLAAVRHLVELGYEDPLDAAARRLAVEQGLQGQFHKAEKLLQASDVERAIQLLEEAARSAPEWTAGRHLLARAYFRAGRLSDASELLQWLEVHAVEHAELSLLRARIALRRRQVAAAIDHADYARCLQNPHPEANLIIAAAHFRRGDFESAADVALQSLEQDFTRWQCHYLLARALLRLGRAEEAKVALESCVRLGPPVRAPYRWLARLYQEQGDHVKAGALEAQARAIKSARVTPRSAEGSGQPR